MNLRKYCRVRLLRKGLELRLKTASINCRYYSTLSWKLDLLFFCFLGSLEVSVCSFCLCLGCRLVLEGFLCRVLSYSFCELLIFPFFFFDFLFLSFILSSTAFSSFSFSSLFLISG